MVFKVVNVEVNYGMIDTSEKVVHKNPL